MNFDHSLDLSADELRKPAEIRDDKLMNYVLNKVGVRDIDLRFEQRMIILSAMDGKILLDWNPGRTLNECLRCLINNVYKHRIKPQEDALAAGDWVVMRVFDDEEGLTIRRWTKGVATLARHVVAVDITLHDMTHWTAEVRALHAQGTLLSVTDTNIRSVSALFDRLREEDKNLPEEYRGVLI